ncbi:TPA_asm: BPSL0067 family protein [Salmonella enterica subsp. enterica serovar Newport]|uniref:BPSL0067 family protein n=1 Tax=Salmonella newport TaxID=108619 RepID=A0A6X8H517_SALNE|nr:BPSL0067 family protein [Salmonella enterica subsp. enterica serovar Newport]HAB2090970.1 BPSL0067 family protein [Salmonella enterica subsp. enterica serovar Newport]
MFKRVKSEKIENIKRDMKKRISSHPRSRKGGVRNDDTYPNASNNAEAFYIIE